MYNLIYDHILSLGKQRYNHKHTNTRMKKKKTEKRTRDESLKYNHVNKSCIISKNNIVSAVFTEIHSLKKETLEKKPSELLLGKRFYYCLLFILCMKVQFKTTGGIFFFK